MIGYGRLQAQLSEIELLLDSLELFEERQYNPNKQLGAAHFRGLTYRQVYEVCVGQFAYDFRLTDQSLLSFITAGNNAHDGSLSFSYLECPVEVMNYREFVGTECDLSVMDDDFDESVDAFGDDLRPQYEQYVNSLESKYVVTPLRYDYKAVDYRSGSHPASHVHVGFANEIRIGTRRVLNPLSFVLLILRQRYPSAWIRLCAMNEAKIWCRNVRADLEPVDRKYWTAVDEQEMSLH